MTAPATLALLSSTFRSIIGEPAQNQLGSLLSLIWIETARGTAINNHNFGNISASERFAGKVWRPPWFDFDGGTADTEANRRLHEAMLRKEAPSAFRAYDAPEQGMADFVSQIQKTFPEVLEAAKGGDPDAFRVALSKKYSPDYKHPRSTETFDRLFKEFGVIPKGEGAASPPSLSLADLPTLRYGSAGSAVRLLGALLGVPGEAFGRDLVGKVLTFQGQSGLVQDGIVGPKTWAEVIAKLG
jgi:hypothetical protein